MFRIRIDMEMVPDDEGRTVDIGQYTVHATTLTEAVEKAIAHLQIDFPKKPWEMTSSRTIMDPASAQYGPRGKDEMGS